MRRRQQLKLVAKVARKLTFFSFFSFLRASCNNLLYLLLLLLSVRLAVSCSQETRSNFHFFTSSSFSSFFSTTAKFVYPRAHDSSVDTQTMDTILNMLMFRGFFFILPVTDIFFSLSRDTSDALQILCNSVRYTFT